MSSELSSIFFAELDAKVHETPTEVVAVKAFSVHGRVDTSKSSDAECASLVNSGSEILHAVSHVELAKFLHRASVLSVWGSLDVEDVVAFLELGWNVDGKSTIRLKSKVLTLVVGGMVGAVNLVLRSEIVFDLEAFVSTEIDVGSYMSN